MIFWDLSEFLSNSCHMPVPPGPKIAPRAKTVSRQVGPQITLTPPPEFLSVSQIRQKQREEREQQEGLIGELGGLLGGLGGGLFERGRERTQN